MKRGGNQKQVMAEGSVGTCGNSFGTQDLLTRTGNFFMVLQKKSYSRKSKSSALGR